MAAETSKSLVVRQVRKRKIKTLVASILLASHIAVSVQPASSQDALTNSVSANSPSAYNAEKNDFVARLMAQMTLDEKIGQLNLLSVGADVTGPILSQGVEEKISRGQVGGVFNIFGPASVRRLQQMVLAKSRLKIPLIFGYDVIHGHRTIFPVPLGLACSWNLDLIEQTAAAAAAEATADGLNWTFSPMVDITRDPRWGRVCEGAGEDPYLGSRVAEAMVRGYQGEPVANALRPDKMLACVKHFALYGAAEAGRDYNTVDMSRLRMYNEYLPPYRAAVEAGVASVMTSFNEIDGVPATGNRWLITDLLRKQWNFKGFVATDYTAITEMVAHGVGDEKKAAQLALNAGVDMDMVGELFTKYGASLVSDGSVPVSQIDAACRRVLEAKYQLGLFANPYRYVGQSRQKEVMDAEKLALSKSAAIKSMVLLKNDRNILPLNSGQKIALIGPLVKDQRNLIGSWSAAGQGKEAMSLWQGCAAKGSNFIYAKGCNLVDDPDLIERLNRDGGELVLDAKPPAALIAEAVEAAKQADVVVAALGEPFCMSGEAASRSNIGLLDNQINLLKALKQTDKPIILVLMNGRPLDLSWADQNLDAILETWYGGTMAGAAIADVLFGESPSGKLAVSFPRNAGQIPIYYAAKNTGRPYVEKEKFHSQYLDVPNSPLYPFGYGLSYGNFKYGNIALSSDTLSPGNTIAITTSVTNSGARPAVETVQLYIRDMEGSVTRPVKELKGFQQINLAPGEMKTVTFNLSEADLRFYNSDLELISESGDFKAFVGSNSRDCAECRFKLVK